MILQIYFKILKGYFRVLTDSEKIFQGIENILYDTNCYPKKGKGAILHMKFAPRSAQHREVFFGAKVHTKLRFGSAQHHDCQLTVNLDGTLT